MEIEDEMVAFKANDLLGNGEIRNQETLYNE
jgi:hypothetical protein